jgi:3-oxoacyl-[acyl-carrier-protein] synthase-1
LTLIQIFQIVHSFPPSEICETSLPSTPHKPLPITAWSAVNALGTTREQISDALREGRTGLARCPVELPFETMSGAVDQPLPSLPSGYRDYECRQAKLALGAFDGLVPAVQQAKRRWGADRVGLLLATSTGGISETENALQVKRESGAFPESFLMERQHNFYAYCQLLKSISGVRGPSHIISTACSSSTKVFAAARRFIEADVIDAAIVGGIDSLCLTTLCGFHCLGILSNERSRPFSGERKGLSIGEGGALLMIEREGDAAVHLLGCAESSDAHHMSSPHPEGLGAVLAMRGALEQSGLEPGDIDHINAHGTGTKHNDASEAGAIEKVFGDTVPVVSTKGYTGHMLGAAGATEAAFACIALEEQWIPGSVGAEPVDPAISMQVNLHTAEMELRYVLSNSFGFGGSNASVVFGVAQ